MRPLLALATGLALAALPAAAGAAKKPKPPPPPKELRPDIDELPDAAGKVKLTAIFFDEDPDTGRTAVQLARAFRLSIKKDDRFAFYEISKLLEQGKLESERTTIEKARADADRGKDLFADFGKVGEALSTYEGAVDSYRAVLGYVPRKEEFTEVLMYYASTLYLEGKHKAECEAVLREVLLLDPDLKYDEDKFPARMVTVFEKVREGLSAAGRGSVEIVSDPPFAEVYVNGSYRGVTPIEVFGLPQGENYVSLRKDGYKKFADTMTVEAEKSTNFEATLEPVFRLTLYEDLRKEVLPVVGDTKAGKPIMTARSVFYVDQVVFVTLAAEGDQLRATLFLYDLRSRLLLKKVTGLLDPKTGEDVDASMNTMIATLYTGVRMDGSVERPEDRIDVGARGKRPIYNRWWFWTGVGGVVLAGVLIPSVYGFLANRKDPIDYCATCGAVNLVGF
jgi:hypothetical protein